MGLSCCNAGVMGNLVAVLGVLIIWNARFCSFAPAPSTALLQHWGRGSLGPSFLSGKPQSSCSCLVCFEMERRREG